MTREELNEHVGQLLKRSTEQDRLATEAKMNGFMLECHKHRTNAEDLYEQAACMDPEFTAPAWKQ